jgi:hypothetical protein
MNIKVGQIWRADDKRFERYIVITHVHGDGVPVFITCDANGKPIPGRRHQNANVKRFGKAGGYKLIGERT